MLPQLQEVWQQLLLQGLPNRPIWLDCCVLEAAAGSPTPDAMQKIEWVF